MLFQRLQRNMADDATAVLCLARVTYAVIKLQELSLGMNMRNGLMLTIPYMELTEENIANMK